jgi:hypothetical protein
VEFRRCAATVYPEPRKNPSRKMKKYTKIIVASIGTLLLGFMLWQVKTHYFRVNIQNEKIAQQISTSLEIDGDGPVTFDISSFVGKTALKATESKAKIVTSGTGTNAFITSINGRTADASKHEFWELDANGKETEVGAGSYIIQKGDIILWHINTY